ncbi:MAG TPA: helix-turn-helix domain-containing protein [Pseudonocardia sp.]|jgi:AcrR family transcriptional regulator|nr:helix-turn-helix domain-containing protein [Pseudonocardia sp.]
MSRWEPNARGRLAEAALALYGEHGFEQTTAAEIAKRAGLTERTFFRHFADKREVLFGGGELAEIVVGGALGAPEGVTPIEMVAAALEATGAMFEDRHAFARQRQAIILANAELLERELIKMASLASALADALRRRGVPEIAANLTAEVGVAVFRVAFERWVKEDDVTERDLPWFIRQSLGELKTVTSGT